MSFSLWFVSIVLLEKPWCRLAKLLFLFGCFSLFTLLALSKEVISVTVVHKHLICEISSLGSPRKRGRINPIVPDPEGIMNQGHGNRTARAIQVRQDESINKRALLNLFQAIIANNRAGGWRKLKGNR